MNVLSCHVFLKNSDSVVMLKCPNWTSEYYFNKEFVIFKCDEENLKTTIFGKLKSWFRSRSPFRLSHAMLYNHTFHFKYTEELVS